MVFGNDRTPSIDVSLPIGTHRITLWVADNEGTVSSPASVTVTITSTDDRRAADDEDRSITLVYTSKI